MYQQTLCLGEGFCNAETENMVYWPETRSGSGPVVVECPENENRTVTRECINGIWTEVDYSICQGQSCQLQCSCHVDL